MARLTKTKLLALISQEIQNSLGFYSSDLATQRKNALKYEVLSSICKKEVIANTFE